jgi:ATP-dependent helicase HrpA
VLGPLAVTLTTPAALQQVALESIRRWVCGREVKPLHAAVFGKKLEEAKRDLRGLVPKVGDWLKETFTLRLALETHKQPYPGQAEDLAALLPPDFLRRMPFDRVQHLPRYLRGMQARAERWKRDAAKDASRARELAPFVAAARKLTGGRKPSSTKRGEGAPPPSGVELAESFRWLVEEFRVSLFAQELGTAEPVSAVRLERALADLGRTNRADEAVSAARPADSPHLKPATTTKKGAPLKSLGALDQLFRK